MSTLDRIIMLLDRYDKTQKELMEHLDLDKSTFPLWKCGKSHSYRKYLPEIARFFDVSVDYLVNNTESKGKVPEELTGIYFKLGKEAQELGLDEEDVETILKTYRKYKGKANTNANA